MPPGELPCPCLKTPLRARRTHFSRRASSDTLRRAEALLRPPCGKFRTFTPLLFLPATNYQNNNQKSTAGSNLLPAVWPIQKLNFVVRMELFHPCGKLVLRTARQFERICQGQHTVDNSIAKCFQFASLFAFPFTFLIDSVA